MRKAYTPDGDGAYDIGGATSGALSRLRAGVPAVDAGGTGDRDQGNGSLMRILPLGLLSDAPDDATLVEQAHLASRVTHGHLNCQVTCALYVLIVRALLERPREEPEAVLARSVDALIAAYAEQPAAERALRGLLARRPTVEAWRRLGARQLLVRLGGIRSRRLVPRCHRALRPVRG